MLSQLKQLLAILGASAEEILIAALNQKLQSALGGAVTVNPVPFSLGVSDQSPSPAPIAINRPVSVIVTDPADVVPVPSIPLSQVVPAVPVPLPPDHPNATDADKARAGIVNL